MNVVLLSRRQSVLDEAAADLQTTWGIATRSLAVDLSEARAAATIAEQTADLEVGLFIYCAGADPEIRPLPRCPARGGGVHGGAQLSGTHPALPSAGSADGRTGPRRHHPGVLGCRLVGARRMAAYGASKAFDLVLGEALWAELHDQGVDVLFLVLGVTDTPTLRRLLAEKGNLASADDGTPIPGTAASEEVVAEAFENLGAGPTWFVGELLREGSRVLGGMGRNEAAQLMLNAGAGVMDQKLS